MREARLYSPAEKGYVDCYLCEFHCHIADGKRGVCGVRENMGGVLYTHIYGRLIAEHIDPIEKKPLFHFQPSSRSYSIATVGCNFRCLHCQNAEISQMPRDSKRILGEEVAPDEVVSEAYETGCSSISYTYTEPTIFFEYAYDTGVLAKERGLKNVFVTNGYMTTECLDELKDVLDAANVDVKSFSENFYRKVCGATLAPVLKSVERMRELGVWVEVTTLVIPTLNDSESELREIAKWIYRTDRSIPWHISAFHPAYKLNKLPPTPASKIQRAREIGLEEGLKYVYTGNIPGQEGESTFCYNCKRLLIERYGFTVKKNLIAGSRCPYCDFLIDGVGL
ncbi:MAG: AmmeMemoRadiSam system radical SAM enzyme [Deltaproteobacteria bacterium]|nr:AmmeMemoRadiSam system radical SAM enzyme [Deltaproteobacteria bacterium]